MRHNVRPPKKNWGSFKADREAACKKLPMRHGHANLAMVAIRDGCSAPSDGLPSEGSTVRSYIRCPALRLLSRRLASLFNRIFGIPLGGYFDDFGALSPGNVGRMALRTFERFFHTIGIKLKKAKTDRCQKIIFHCIRGDSPPRSNNIIGASRSLRRRRGLGPQRSKVSRRQAPSPAPN